MNHKFQLKGLTYYLQYEKLGPATKAKLSAEGGLLPFKEAITMCSLKDRYSPLKGRKIATARVLVKAFPDKADREEIWKQLLGKPLKTKPVAHLNSALNKNHDAWPF